MSRDEKAAEAIVFGIAVIAGLILIVVRAMLPG